MHIWMNLGVSNLSITLHKCRKDTMKIRLIYNMTLLSIILWIILLGDVRFCQNTILDLIYKQYSVRLIYGKSIWDYYTCVDKTQSQAKTL